LVTHSHLDHSPLAASLSKATNAPILAFGPSDAGRSAAMNACVNAGMTSGGEGIDLKFRPNITLSDGEQVQVGDQTITALHTPGHMGNHMCFLWQDTAFCGDLVMGWASSLVSPPDGDLTDFMISCAKLRRANPSRMHAGHGAPIENPISRIDWLIAHRKTREAQILAQLENGPNTARALAEKIYTDTPDSLLPAATRNVFAHLIDLEGRALISRFGVPDEMAKFSLNS